MKYKKTRQLTAIIKGRKEVNNKLTLDVVGKDGIEHKIDVDESIYNVANDISLNTPLNLYYKLVNNGQFFRRVLTGIKTI